MCKDHHAYKNLKAKSGNDRKWICKMYWTFFTLTFRYFYDLRCKICIFFFVQPNDLVWKFTLSKWNPFFLFLYYKKNKTETIGCVWTWLRIINAIDFNFREFLDSKDTQKSFILYRCEKSLPCLKPVIFSRL